MAYDFPVRITIDIDEKTLNELTVITGERKKSPAVAKAVSEFVRRAKLREFGRSLFMGEFARAFEEDFDPKKLGQ